MTKKPISKQYEEIISFLKFKNNNEITHCTFVQNSFDSNKNIVWKTTKKYNKSLENIHDIEKISNYMQEMVEENKVDGIISKITCSDNCHIVEFSFYP
jgi:benzoyl-CoA reductase/2-hydroxyglutaryl-CoA dehydratase subunit BcrC/BadD/HgdB